MNNLNDRLKTIRKHFNLSQVEFGKAIGISRSQVACYENGIRPITDRSINDICREFNINKDWFLNGNGNMIETAGNDDNLMKALAYITMNDDSRLKNIVMNIAKLDSKYFDLINNLINDLLILK